MELGESDDWAREDSYPEHLNAAHRVYAYIKSDVVDKAVDA